MDDLMVAYNEGVFAAVVGTAEFSGLSGVELKRFVERVLLEKMNWSDSVVESTMLEADSLGLF
jgi:hypothetical protein